MPKRIKSLLKRLLVYSIFFGFVNFMLWTLLNNEKKHEFMVHKLSKPHLFAFKNKTYHPENCIKKNPNQTYKVCTELPYTEIKCGPKYSQAKAEQSKPFLVPDIIFFIWFGDNLKFQFFNYLALRSAAAIHQPERIDFYYSISLPVGKYWERTRKEISCLNLLQISEPQTLAGREIPFATQRTDVARLEILLRHGGIYIDGDAITLKNLDPLRIYPATLGRATRNNVCICIVTSRKNSLFIREYYKHIASIVPQDGKVLFPHFTQALGDFVKDIAKVKVHIEESSMNRPNPYVLEDGRFGTTLRSMNISNNYFLHLHASSLYDNEDLSDWLNWDEETLRTLEGAYGEAARIALFGSSDFIFKHGEDVYNMEEQTNIFQFSPIIQKNAIFEDEDIFDLFIK